MKLVKDILYKVPLQQVTGSTDIHISSLVFDSRKVKQDDLFVALKGTASDGHLYIPQVVAAGAKAILCEDMPSELNPEVTYIQVADSHKALAIMACNYYNNPSEKLKLVGITGTNGKTTTATLLFTLFESLGHRSGLISTVKNHIHDQVIPSTHTTPDALQLNALLNAMVEDGCEYCFMEVSSHAVVQRRIDGLHFSGGVFTNITHDHLDYHKTFAEYIKAKKGFFDQLPANAFALTNVDDKNGPVMVQNTKATKCTYSLSAATDFKCRIIENGFNGLLLNIDNTEVLCRLIGSFNAYNLLAVYASSRLLGMDKQETLTRLSMLGSVDGRFEYLRAKNGITGIVDYAHTPDALENVLKTISDIRKPSEKVITVVGCGGDRDMAKRPIMAKIAIDHSDQVILTSDNPRTEDPIEIIKQMEQGVSNSMRSKSLSISDRKEAIRTAIRLAKPGDIILIAGKGHENYQEIMGVKHPFSDKEILREELSNLNS